MAWFYNGQEVKYAPEGFYGFIYKITDPNGKIYIGKKAFYFSKKMKTSKKERAQSGKRVKRVVVDSNWENYWGSCEPLLEYLKKTNSYHLCKREILKLCEDKISLSYWEMAFLVKEGVLFSEKYWNNNILGKFYKGRVKL